MRRLALGLLASTALTVGFGQVGSAADLKPVYKAKPVQKAAPALAAYSWTGFYVGAHAGYRWADAELSADPFSFTTTTTTTPHPFNIPGRSETFHPNGGIFGLHGGYNYQFNPSWLAGIELDISWADHSATHLFSTTDGFSTLTLTRNSTLRLGSQGSVRGRLGWVGGPWLIYATGGVSFVRAEWTESWSPVITLLGPPMPFAVSADKILAGWTLGVGGEYMFAPHWAARLEYLYTDYGRFSVPLALTTNTGSLDVRTQVLRAGLSYLLAPSP